MFRKVKIKIKNQILSLRYSIILFLSFAKNYQINKEMLFTPSTLFEFSYKKKKKLI